MGEVLQREFVYIWYYFTIQLRQIFPYWVLGMVIGSFVSVFAKERIHHVFQSLGERKPGVLGIIAASALGIASPLCMYGTIPIAASNGAHQIFDLGYVKVEAVEAGYNSLHDVSQCVGYVLTFSNGKSVYVTGDTSKTEQMALMDDMEIDYAFFCCDGVYNMGLEEAAECAALVGAKHNIPYHMTATTTGRQFDRELAEQFDVENRLIVEDGEEILIE